MLLCAGAFFLAGQIWAWWVMTDPGSLAQSIVNTSNNIIRTPSTVTNTAQDFAETMRIYQQYKRHYDALESVNDLAKDARKVSEVILTVGDVSEIYVTNFQKMLGDEDFSSEELGAIAFGYTKLLEESNGVLQDLRQVVNVSTLPVTDKNRIDVADDCYASMHRYRSFMNYYTNGNIAMSFLRARKENDLDRVLKLYGSDTSKHWQPMVLLPVDSLNLHTVLESLYNEMIPLCEDMLNVAEGLAGFGALFYMVVRVWQSLARVEPIDMYLLLRSFAAGICIVLLPTLILGMMNMALSSIVQGTHKMLEG